MDQDLSVNLSKMRMRELFLARRVVLFFIKFSLQQYWYLYVLSVLLIIVMLAGQFGFLLLLPALIAAIMPAGEGGAAVVQGGVPNAAVPLLESIPLDQLPAFALIAAACGLLLLTAATLFAQQWAASSLNVGVFRALMRKTLRRLIVFYSHPTGGSRIEVKKVTNLFTKSCRYGGLIGFRSLRLLRPLISLPAVLAFCIWQSPLLTAVVFGVFVLAVPVHLLVMTRGIGSMRRLLASAAQHSSSKKAILNHLMQYPSWHALDVDSLEKTAVDDGSSNFLKAYFERRLLGAASNAVNLVAIAVGLAVVFGVLVSHVSEADWDIAKLLVFVLALRMLVTNVGQMVTDVTMISSYTPLCENLYSLFVRRLEEIDVPMASREGHRLKAPSDILPGLLLFTTAPQAVPALQAILAQLTGETAWHQAGVVRGDYPPFHRSLHEDLFLEKSADSGAPLVPMPPASQEFLKAALERESRDGWSEALWEEIPASIKLYCTLNAALAKGAKEVILVGVVQSQFGGEYWRDVKRDLLAQQVSVVQVLGNVPKSLTVGVGMTVAFHDGEQTRILGVMTEGADMLARVRDAYDDVRNRDQEKIDYADIDSEDLE